MSEVAFLVDQIVLAVDEARRIFDHGLEVAPRLYADVGDGVCTDQHGNVLPLTDVVGETVVSASTGEGALTLAFERGQSLITHPDPHFEAWQVVGGRPQYLVVCLPGGELAVWDERHVPSDAEAEETVQRLLGPAWRVRERTKGGAIQVEQVPPPEGD